MSEGWDDFEGSSSKNEKSFSKQPKTSDDSVVKGQTKPDDDFGCQWGMARQDASGEGVEATDESKFIPIYENYLDNKHEFIKKHTKNHNLYSANPQKALKEWFESEGHELKVKTEQPSENKFISSLDIPIDDQDFTITSDIHDKKQLSLDELFTIACRLLDSCELLYSDRLGSKDKADPDKKRRSTEANKDDDIELDSTSNAVKRHCVGLIQKSQVNTYESLLAKWNELNKCILMSKARLVKLDLSVSKSNEAKNVLVENEDDDEEVDPLDEFMSGLNTKTKLSMDDKIEKSRIKTEIETLEREQEKVSHLIDLAKPKFDLDKACPRKVASRD